MIHLEGQLRRHPEMQDAIRRGIEAIQSQMKFFEAEENGEAVHPRLVEKLAELYSQTISTLTPRIMVNGEHGHLSNPLIAAKVRAALFAGIRSAFLWRQLGGNRLAFPRDEVVDLTFGVVARISVPFLNSPDQFFSVTFHAVQIVVSPEFGSARGLISNTGLFA
jgi:high frequency lysogenization protein